MKYFYLVIITLIISSCDKGPEPPTLADQQISNNSNSTTENSKAESKSERIKFSSGAYSATVTSELNGFDSEKTYVIEVAKGQQMTIEQMDRSDNRYVSVYLTAPDGSNADDMDLSCHSTAKVSSTKPGDYIIQVVQCAKADPWKGSFNLKVTVK
ncbi:MAG: hypothetical protein V3U78_03175 [Thiotrichaceae bacterium]